MKLILSAALATVVLGSFYSPVARGEIQIFVCWEGLKGGSTFRGFEDCSLAKSFSLIVGEPDNNAGEKKKKIQCEQNVSMEIDTASPGLALLALSKDTFNFTASFVDLSGVPVVALEVVSTDWLVRRVASGGSINDFPGLQEILLAPSGSGTSTITEMTGGAPGNSAFLNCGNG